MPKSEQVNKPVPEFSLPTLSDPAKNFTNKDLEGRYSLLNIFASWCYTCRLEHDTLLSIAGEGKLPVYGVAWKDKPQNASQWLENLGNPYTKVGMDWFGELVVPLGLIGTPESFLINPDGVIIYHHQGMLTSDRFQSEILPLIQ